MHVEKFCRKLICSECDYKTDTYQKLEEHLAIEHHKTLPQCLECRRTFCNSSSLVKHCKAVHGYVVFDNSSTDEFLDPTSCVRIEENNPEIEWITID